MHDQVLRGEVYCRLRTIEKHYKKLSNISFPTDGPDRLLDLTTRIIEKILGRFPLYTIEQVRHIAQLCCAFETICGYLSESRMGNVPWSILPAIEKLFGSVQQGNEFAICPIWENNYKIVTRNVVAYYKEVAQSGNLLFDAPDRATLDREMKEFFGPYPEGIYFLFYPRLERISAIHFALLGHEIGHIFADRWVSRDFAAFAAKHKLEEGLERLACEEWRRIKTVGLPGDSPNLFMSAFVTSRKGQYLDICWKVMKEIIADIFGAFVFGDTALVAQYLFFHRGDMDDVMQWREGYPSHRYRLGFGRRAIQYLRKNEGFPAEVKCGWEDLIGRCADIRPSEYAATTDEYVRFIVATLDEGSGDLLETVARELDRNVFTQHVEKEMIEAAIGRLRQNVIPNVFVHEDSREIPIDFRSILYATTLCLAEGITGDLEEYEAGSKIINLLSIKGIELSTEQELFQKNDPH